MFDLRALRREDKISTLPQKPRLRLQYAMMSDTMDGAFAMRASPRALTIKQ
jgi:hypothetical protein